MNVKQANTNKTCCSFPPLSPCLNLPKLEASKPGRRVGALCQKLPGEKQLRVVGIEKNLRHHNHFRMFLEAFVASSISYA